LFFPVASFAVSVAPAVIPVVEADNYLSLLLGLLPSEAYLLAYNNAGAPPSQSSFGISDKLKAGSEHTIAFFDTNSQTAFGISDKQKDLLFAPTPPGNENGGGDAVGEAPVRECAWILLLCCLVYGIHKIILKSKFRQKNKNQLTINN
jgi:hypothetical protein